MFYTNFIILCNKIGKAPSAVAEEIGYARATVTAWKDGKMPRPATLQKIASYFHITVEELLKEQKEPAPLEGDGRSGQVEEWIKAWEEATPEARQAALAVLRLQGKSREDRD